MSGICIFFTGMLLSPKKIAGPSSDRSVTVVILSASDDEGLTLETSAS